MDAAPAACALNPGQPDEATLIDGLRKGDEAAFEMTVRLHGGNLFAAARRLLQNEQDAQDAVQEALLSAFKSIHQFQGEARLGTWLHRIVVNRSLEKLRVRQRRQERNIDDLLPCFYADGHRVNPQPAWEEPASAALQRHETCEQVRRAIDELPEMYRTVLVLRDIEEFDTEETARSLGVTAGVVKTRLHRARQALRTLLDPHIRGGSL